MRIRSFCIAKAVLSVGIAVYIAPIKGGIEYVKNC